MSKAFQAGQLVVRTEGASVRAYFNYEDVRVLLFEVNAALIDLPGVQERIKEFGTHIVTEIVFHASGIRPDAIQLHPTEH